jgi:serine/threonine-protein kinase
MSDLRAALADALGPLYRVEREVRPVGDDRLFVIAAGELGPALLVKVLPAAASLAINVLAFERDLLLLADRLHHPNLTAPKGGGRAGSFVYHMRPFVPGTTLHAWMARHGIVPLARAVEIIRGILTGLAHAHAAGIAHGSLKAESVILGTEGIVLTDVGIARVQGRAASRTGDMITLGALVRLMLVGRAFDIPDEPLEQSRTLPPWLAAWLETRWGHAGEALAAFQLPGAS